MDLYREQIVDLAKNPLNRRGISDATVTHSGVNAACGDRLRLYLKVKGDTIVDASWEGEGCAISVAAVSLLTDALKQMPLTKAKALINRDILNLLGIEELGPARIKCAVLCLETLSEALKDY